MADTPSTYFSDPRKKALDHLNSECFALEQLAKQYGHPDIQHALYRVRATEMAHADTFLRGQIRREVDAAAGVAAAPAPQPLRHNKHLCADCTTEHACKNRLDLPRPCWGTDGVRVEGGTSNA